MIQVLPFVRITRIGGHATQGKCARVFCSLFCFSPKPETTCSFDHFMIAASERACVVCWFRNCHALHRDKRKLKRDQMWVSFDLKHRWTLLLWLPIDIEDGKTQYLLESDMQPDLDGDKLLIADNSRLVAHKSEFALHSHTHTGNVLNRNIVRRINFIELHALGIADVKMVHLHLKNYRSRRRGSEMQIELFLCLHSLLGTDFSFTRSKWRRTVFVYKHCLWDKTPRYCSVFPNEVCHVEEL